MRALFAIRDTSERVAQEKIFVDRLLATLSAGFAALATLLAGVGLYSVIAYNVTARTRELGLRLALEAEARTCVGCSSSK